MEKNLATKELKQIWNSPVAVVVVVAFVAVVVAVASVAVAILKQRHRRFCMRYLKDYDLEFLNLEDTHPRLLFTPIFIYKRSTHAKEKGNRRPRRKIVKKLKKNKIQERD